MSGARRATIALGAVLMALAAFAALWPALRAGWRAATSASAAQTQAPDSLRIVAVDSSDRSLQLRFERSNGAVGHLALVRDGPESPWRAEPAVGAPGVLLGDGYPVFATPRFLAVHGLDSSSALRPIDASIAEETADDVTVIRFWGGEIAICLWRHGKVVRAGLAGPIFEALRATTVARDPPERAAASNAPDAPGEIAASDACGRLAAILRADDAA
ncbi:MAG: hypothetical protein FJ253_07205, partial [Phycisphaerae bacterium]|nr:hypothetical protein [Phycisphaerae bacterium]